MAKQITFKASNGNSVTVPLKAFAAIEAAGHIAVIGISTGVGAIIGHPFIGFIVGVGIVVASEVAEYVFVKKAIQKGKLSVSVQ